MALSLVLLRWSLISTMGISVNLIPLNNWSCVFSSGNTWKGRITEFISCQHLLPSTRTPPPSRLARRQQDCRGWPQCWWSCQSQERELWLWSWKLVNHWQTPWISTGQGMPHSRMKTHWSVLAWRNVEVTKVLGASLGASCPRTDAKRRKANILQENFSQCWCVKSCHVQ